MLNLAARKLSQNLKALGACHEAVEWCKGKSFTKAWNTCERADWMLWLCAKMIGKEGWPSHQKVVLAACLCAERSLSFFEKKHPNDDRPRKAIEIARAWAAGKATIEEVRITAAYAAYAAAYAADAAYYAAADAAAYAAYYAARAAHAAANAAAAYAAYAASAAAYADELKEMAEVVRKNLKVPKSL